MSNDLFRVLRQLGAAADVTSFLQLNCKACATLIRNKPDSDDFRRLQRQGYSALVLAALSKGLQLYNAAAAGQRDSSPSAAVLLAWLDGFTAVVITNVAACSDYWGEGSQQAKNMEQELLNSGVLPVMQQSWRQLAAGMEQQQRALQQHPDSTAEQPAAQTAMFLARSASLSGELLQLWIHCSNAAYEQNQLSKLNAAVSSVPFLADVATGIAAIWRSEGVLQQWRAASSNAAAAPPTHAVMGATAPGGSTASNTAAAGRAQHSAGRLDQQANDEALCIPERAVQSSMGAAGLLGLQLFLFMNRREAQHLPGSGAAPDLQWVMLVYTAMLVGKLHQRQQGVSPVQLHTQPAPGSQGSAGSSSSSSSSSKKGSSKKASRAQQASSSSAAASSQQGSMVPLHHLQVLHVAGVPVDRLIEYADLREHGSPSGGAVPTAATAVNVLLQELQAHLELTGPSSSSSSRRSSSSNSTHPSTSTGHGSSASSDIPSDGVAAVLALLGPCSLVWGEFLALHLSTGVDEASPVASVTALVTSLWYTSVLLLEVAPAEQLPARTQQKQQQHVSKAYLQDSWYRSCVELIVPSLLHMRAAGAIAAADYSAAAGCFFERLELLLLERLTETLFEGNTHGVPEPSTLPDGCPPPLPIFSNPAACITSLEAAVRHKWDATGPWPCAASTGDVGPRLACVVVIALVRSFTPLQHADGSSHLLLSVESSGVLQHGTNRSKSPALLSLLLSCVKQLQHSCQGSAQGALAAAGLTGVVGDLTVELYKLCVTFRGSLSGTVGTSSSAGVSAASSSVSSSAPSTGTALDVMLSSTGAPRVLEFSISTTALQDDSTPSEPSAAEAAPSTGADLPSEAASSAGSAVGEEAAPRLTAEGTSRVANTWLMLLSRVLYTAGAAMQAIASGAAPTSASKHGLRLPRLLSDTSAASSLGGLSRGLQKYAGLAGMFMESDTAASAVARKKRSSTVQMHVQLHGADAANPAMQAYQALGQLLSAAAQHAEELEDVADSDSTGSTGSTGSTDSTDGFQSSATSDMAIWQQVLGSEQGRQLPQALMDVGSLLCAALPSRSCCNEPSCCCLDKPSELQLAGGKGTKCSGCGVARYCSPAHQRLHWKQHKPACKAIAAAAAADASR